MVNKNYLKMVKLGLFTVFLNSLLMNQLAHADNIKNLEVVKNNAINFSAPEPIKTMVIGNPDLIKVNIIKTNFLIINGAEYGTTSLSLFGKSGAVYDYKVHVTRDLIFLKSYLKNIDPRIEVNSDPNGEGVILSGTAKHQDLINQAWLTTVKFFGNYNTKFLDKQQTEITQDSNPNGESPDATEGQTVLGPTATNFTLNGQYTLKTRIVNLILNEDATLPAHIRLKNLLSEIDNRITVDRVNNVFVLKGKVKTPAALARALSTADRFVAGGSTQPDFSVISDHGGVLAGNTDERQQATPAIPRQGRAGGNNQGGNNQGGNNQGGNNRNNQNGSVNNQNATGALTISSNKGNLAQNIARGDVVMAANGRVMSTIKVDKNPRVEIQMRIVGVDRNKTEDLGIDWRLISSQTSGGTTTSVSIGSFLGNVVDTLPGINGNSTNGVDVGTSTLVLDASRSTANKILSLSSFLRWVETKGAAKTLTEPLLTALSGESATFTVGGTLPVLTQDQTTFSNNGVTQNTATNITFLQYGLGIVARPTVLENGKISIVLDQTLSEPDYSVAVPGFQSAQIPGFRTRTINTITESSSGETWAVAGLLNEEDTNTLRSVPFLSRIPVLGWLFKNENKGKSRRELLLVVTARLIDDDGSMIGSSNSLKANDAKSINNQNNQKTPTSTPLQKEKSKIKPTSVVPQPVQTKSIATASETTTEMANDLIYDETNNTVSNAIIPVDNTQNLKTSTQKTVPHNKTSQKQTLIDEKGELTIEVKREFDSGGAGLLNNQQTYYRTRPTSNEPKRNKIAHANEVNPLKEKNPISTSKPNKATDINIETKAQTPVLIDNSINPTEIVLDKKVVVDEKGELTIEVKREYANGGAGLLNNQQSYYRTRPN